MAGIKPQGKVKIKWSPKFAYAIGLLATDGNLANDGRHMNFTSKDEELALLFKECLGLSNKIGKKTRGTEPFKKYYFIQFGDVLFYKFLLDIGLTPAKSKILGAVDVPKKYFFDFLRGLFDGDGSFYSYYDPRWRSSFMFYTTFVSASREHIEWLRSMLKKKSMVIGYITFSGRSNGYYQLRYAKKESLKIIKKMYYTPSVTCLERKRLKIQRALSIIGIVL